MTTTKFIDSLNETKYNSILKRPRGKRPPPGFDLLGYETTSSSAHSSLGSSDESGRAESHTQNALMPFDTFTGQGSTISLTHIGF